MCIYIPLAISAQIQYSNSFAGIVPSIGDIDGDGKSEIISTFFSQEIYAWKYNGTILDGWPVQMKGSNSVLPPVAGDLDGDGDNKAEIVAISYGGIIYAYEDDGTLSYGWPAIVDDPASASSPVITDIDGDLKNDLVYISGYGNIHILSLIGNANINNQWSMLLNNQRHTGSYSSNSLFLPALLGRSPP